jgi:hypothetical protein
VESRRSKAEFSRGAPLLLAPPQMTLRSREHKFHPPARRRQLNFKDTYLTSKRFEYPKNIEVQPLTSPTCLSPSTPPRSRRLQRHRRRQLADPWPVPNPRSLRAADRLHRRLRRNQKRSWRQRSCTKNEWRKSTRSGRAALRRVGGSMAPALRLRDAQTQWLWSGSERRSMDGEGHRWRLL